MTLMREKYTYRIAEKKDFTKNNKKNYMPIKYNFCQLLCGKHFKRKNANNAKEKI